MNICNLMLILASLVVFVAIVLYLGMVGCTRNVKASQEAFEQFVIKKQGLYQIVERF